MDLGFFKRSQRHFATWMIAPMLVLVSVCLFGWFYSRVTHDALDRRRAYMTLLPAIDRKLATALSLLQSFAVKTADGVGIVDALTTDIQKTARVQAFTVNSLSFKETVSDNIEDQDSVTTWIGVIKGEGSLTSVVRFIRELYTRHRLMVVDSISLEAVGMPSSQRYIGELRLRFLQVNLPNDVELVYEMEMADDES